MHGTLRWLVLTWIYLPASVPATTRMTMHFVVRKPCKPPFVIVTGWKLDPSNYLLTPVCSCLAPWKGTISSIHVLMYQHHQKHMEKTLVQFPYTTKHSSHSLPFSHGSCFTSIFYITVASKKWQPPKRKTVHQQKKKTSHIQPSKIQPQPKKPTLELEFDPKKGVAA